MLLDYGVINGKKSTISRLTSVKGIGLVFIPMPWKEFYLKK